MTDFGVIADIGGTNARFALVDSNKQISQITKLPVSDYANFEGEKLVQFPTFHLPVAQL